MKNCLLQRVDIFGFLILSNFLQFPKSTLAFNFNFWENGWHYKCTNGLKNCLTYKFLKSGPKSMKKRCSLRKKMNPKNPFSDETPCSLTYFYSKPNLWSNAESITIRLHLLLCFAPFTIQLWCLHTHYNQNTAAYIYNKHPAATECISFLNALHCM